MVRVPCRFVYSFKIVCSFNKNALSFNKNVGPVYSFKIVYSFNKNVGPSAASMLGAKAKRHHCCLFSSRARRYICFSLQ